MVLLLALASLSGCIGDGTPTQSPDGFDDHDGDGHEPPDEATDDGASDEADASDDDAPDTRPDDNATEASDPAVPTWGGLEAPIRPGAPIGWCTYNFLFHVPGNDTYYVGTAAHCTDGPGQRMPLAGFREEIGTVVYDSDNATEGPHADFSLVLLDDGLNLEANPAMMNRDGPTGYTRAEQVEMWDVLEHHGYGMVFGEVEPARDRVGFFSGWSGGAGHDFCSESPIWWGDSGSPVLHQATGTAFGIVSRAGWTACLPAAQNVGATVAYILEELARHGWAGVGLATV